MDVKGSSMNHMPNKNMNVACNEMNRFVPTEISSIHLMFNYVYPKRKKNLLTSISHSHLK